MCREQGINNLKTFDPEYVFFYLFSSCEEVSSLQSVTGLTSIIKSGLELIISATAVMFYLPWSRSCCATYFGSHDPVNYVITLLK